MATNPTVQRRRLGIALRRAREAASKTREEAAGEIDAAPSKITRIEQGQSGLRLTDLGILLNLYGVSGPEAESMKEMARAGRQRGRWSAYRESLPTWFRQYIDLESDASEIRWYQTEIMPGILQIESYIRPIMAAGPRTDPDELERQVQVRLQRQSSLDESNAADLNFILSESALRRTVGSTATMRDQLAFLIEVSKRSNVTLQVLPFSAETYAISSFPFIILRFNDDATSDTIYTEDYRDAVYLDRPDDVKAYSRLWGELQAAALGAVESRRLIAKIADQVKESGS
ncbi:helix-turn-helix domain-containing protein [Paractinoplanes toevensis]|uniref:helix-turn-helix domain-containing protein n=1 Tax=Paractinoplanes toevensis TaxID=571911 RepID=UPI001FE852ED|nr:helix-turn-helix transcriptional regulator [Actinoplanes toevensis]